MGNELSKKEIGERIINLRLKKGFSQDDLAKSIGISRPSLTQIELGNRGISFNEMQKLSVVLSFSLDDFVSEKFYNKQYLELPDEAEENISEERISVPILNINKFKNILLYILERCSGKPNVGETVLYKLLYFSDFNYYELYEEHLTGANYKKLPYGPVPQKLDVIIDQMIELKQLEKIKTDYKGFPQKRFIPLEKADLTRLKASEKDVIDKVIDQMSDWSANAISDYSHKDLPWEVTEIGNDISYNLAFYRELPYSVRVYDEEEND